MSSFWVHHSVLRKKYKVAPAARGYRLTYRVLSLVYTGNKMSPGRAINCRPLTRRHFVTVEFLSPCSACACWQLKVVGDKISPVHATICRPPGDIFSPLQAIKCGQCERAIRLN